MLLSAAVRQADTTKVRLTITPGAFGSSNSYTVTNGSGLTDTAGNTIGTPNSATFSGSATAPTAASLAAASDAVLWVTTSRAPLSEPRPSVYRHHDREHNGLSLR